MIIDAGVGDKMDAKSVRHLRHRSHARPRRHAGAARADARRHRPRARLAPALRSRRRLHARATASGALVPRFPRARYRRAHGEWEDATHPHERNRASYLQENFVPLRDAGVVDFVRGDEDDHARRARRADRRPHHASIRSSTLESGGRTAVFAADLIPTTAHVDDAVDHGLRPVSDGHARVQARVRPRGDRPRVPDLLRARSRGRGGLSSARRTAAVTCEAVAVADGQSPDVELTEHVDAIGIIGGSGLYDMAELTDREERTRRRRRSAIRPAPYVHRHAARQARRLPRAARRRPPAAADRAQFPREHLRVEAARRRVHPLGERGRQPARSSTSRCDLVIPDQFFDRTKGRVSARSSATASSRTSAFAHPFCAPLSDVALRRRPARRGATVHKGGTYVCMEGPQFSTLAESKLYRSWGMDIIGMTNLQEAKLAREAEICYSTIALVTDYDCWHPDHDSGDRRHDHRQPDAEREDGAAGHRRRRRPPAVRAHLRVRQRAQTRDHHAPGRGPRSGANATWRRSSAST